MCMTENKLFFYLHFDLILSQATLPMRVLWYWKLLEIKEAKKQYQQIGNTLNMIWRKKNNFDP